MADNIFLHAELREVFYRIGTFPNDQKPIYKRAPFSLLQIQNVTDGRSSQYVMPDSYAPTKAGGQGTQDPRWAADTLPDEPWGLGHNSLRTCVLEEHQMGAWQSDDDWKAVHAFSYL